MLLLIALLIIASVFSTKISTRFGIPVLILFIGIGLLAGSDGLNLINFKDFAMTRNIADFILIFVLFVGGFQTKKEVFRPVAAPAMLLATLGVLLTALLLALIIHFVTSLDLAYSFMIAAIISSTDASAVMMITRSNPFQSKVATTIEIESAANDPAAIILTIAAINIVTGGGEIQIGLLTLKMLWQLGGGLLVGYGLSFLNRYLFDHLHSSRRGDYLVLIVGVVLATYGVAELVNANGIIAVFFMGYLLGNRPFSGKAGVSSFLDGVLNFGNMTLFLMFGLIASPHRFKEIWLQGTLVAFALIFIVRPIVIHLLLHFFPYNRREKLLISWGGIKGAVPIVLATYPIFYGVDPDGKVFDIIFFAVLISCLFQGLTLVPFGNALKLMGEQKPTVNHSFELHSLRQSNIHLVDVTINENSWIVGCKLSKLRFSPEIHISSVIRNDVVLIPSRNLVFQPNDTLFLLIPDHLTDQITDLFDGDMSDWEGSPPITSSESTQELRTVALSTSTDPQGKTGEISTSPPLEEQPPW